MMSYKSEELVSDDVMLASGEFVLEQLVNWTNSQQLVLNEDHLLLQQQDDTMEATTKFSLVQNEFTPVSPIGPPDRTIYTGDLKFEVEICGADTHKSKYMYSHRLNRIYVDMGYSFSVRLNWDPTVLPNQAMYVRATPVFSDQAQAEKRVERCVQHLHDKTKNDVEMSAAMLHSVLRSTRDVGTQDVYYCGGESPDLWYSVVVRLAAPTTHAYQFACKNSCTSGINRRSIAVIFTLEDQTGRVWGRQSVGARVCSCPKRDMKRDEEEEAPRRNRPLVRRPAPAAPPATPAITTSRAKKIRVEVRTDDDSDAVIQLPQISVMGRRVVDTGLGVMLSMMEERRNVVARGLMPTDQLDTHIAQLDTHIAQLRQYLERP